MTELAKIQTKKVRATLISTLEELAEIRLKNGCIYVKSIQAVFTASEFCKVATAEQILTLISERLLFALQDKVNVVLKQ